MSPLTVSATQAKLRFGALMKRVKRGRQVIVKNNRTSDPSNAVVWISLDDYEDYLETHDKAFQADIEKGYQEMKAGKYGTLDDLYLLHRKKIEEEAHQKKMNS